MRQQDQHSLMVQAYLLFLILAITIGLFVWGYWRYDFVALLSLMTLVFLGVIPTSNAFIGFGNPAVITVACVMVITRAITQTGIVDDVVKRLLPLTDNLISHIAILCLTTAILSAFMNNVGALALMMPVAIQSAIKTKRSPSLILMPLAFSSVLGGLTTAIGTPPNLLISAYKEKITGSAFAMFDFTPVGLTVAIVGTLFIAILGWRLVPIRIKYHKSNEDLYQIKDYITEILIPEHSPTVGMTRQQLECLIEGDFSIIGLIRGRRKRLAIAPDEVIQSKDVLMIEASHEDLQSLLKAGKFELVGGEIISPERLRGDDIAIIEAVVPPGSRVEQRSWQRMRIRSRYRINLLAIARSGQAFKKRLNHVNLRGGDVLLLQGFADNLQDTIVSLGLLPLAERGIEVGFRRKALVPIIIFGAAIILSALQILEVQIAFSGALVLLVLFNVLPMRQVYRYIDWSIIMLLAAMIPIGGALQSTGATNIIVNGVLSLAGNGMAPWFILLVLMFITMTLSDIMNNAATAVVMAPIAVGLGQALHMDINAFLMAVAISASCSFLTPISHQNNTLVMGPGGYKFFDYLKLGLAIEALVLIISIPILYFYWL